jgi:glycosyltransferase involved in cell wall biosynthesis
MSGPAGVPHSLRLSKHAMITDRNIICFSNDWHSDPTSKHQIMRILSRSNRILWVNSIGLRRPSLEKRDMGRMLSKVRSFSRGLERVNDNLFVFTPIVVPFHHSTLAQGMNAAALKLSLEYYVRKLDMRNVIYWSYLPNVHYIIKRMRPGLIIYHCVDEWSKFSFIDPDIVEKERALCRMADLVLVSARELFKSKSPYNPNTHYVSHGVDYAYFHEAPLDEAPPEMIGIGKPVAGFFGLIHEWIDLELLDYLIRKNPAVSFVFIGKQSVDVSKLAAHPNAHFLGQKRYDELVRYARRFDVGLIPFRINELTVNVNPIKLKEYLALGIPVVSVNLPEVSAYGQVVRVADGYEAFDAALKEELSGRHKASPEEIDRVARGETWDRKVEEISTLVEALG